MMLSDHDWALTVLCEESRPDAAVTVSEWADEHRVLSSKASAEPGLWRTDRTPYLREIMDALSSYSTVETVVVMKGAQVGMSEAGLNFIGYCVHHAPGPALYVMPTVETVKRISKTRLDPMIEASPVLQERIPPARSRDASNTMFAKEFLGGVLILTGANSASALRSSPIRYLVLDEVDAYPANVDDEGDPVTLAIKRSDTFLRRKIFMLSTPGVKGFSRIGKAFREGDQRWFHVACDACGERQPIVWSGIRWPEGMPEAAVFACRACGHEHPEHRKTDLIAGGSWLPTAEPKRAGLRSYHLSSLYSPWKSWGDCAVEFRAAFGDDNRADPALLQPFVNTVLGEEWEDASGERVDAAGLMEVREDYLQVQADRLPVLPAKVACLTAGVDVQPDRIELEVVGWGRDEESWSIDFRVIPGDPSAPALWDELDATLLQRWPHLGAPDGLALAAVCVDTGGHNTMAAYEFVKPRQKRRVWGIKGAGDYRAPIWPKRPGRTNKGKIDLYSVGVHAAKDVIYKRLARTGPEFVGAGTCHFPADRDAGYFEQLTAEVKRTKFIRGFPVPFFWKPDHARNEALDCRVYAYAALHGLFALGFKLNATAEQIAAAVEAARAAGQSRPAQVERALVPGPVRSDLPKVACNSSAPKPVRPDGWIRPGRTRSGGWLSR